MRRLELMCECRRMGVVVMAWAVPHSLKGGERKWACSRSARKACLTVVVPITVQQDAFLWSRY